MSDWLDAEQRIELAQRLCESQEWERALEQIDKALEIHPGNSAWWSSKAYLLDQLERHGEAIAAYEAALALEPEDCELLTALGLDCIRTGQLQRALALFEQVQRLDPDYEPAYCHRIMLYTELGQHELAEQMFYLAQQIDEHCPHCYWHLGCSMSFRGDFKRAIFCWQRVLELQPAYRGARRQIAEAHRRLGEFALARDYYLAEYREDPSNLELLLELGLMHLQIGQLEEAIAKFRQALELDPHSARAAELLGDAYSRACDDGNALQAYHTALLLDASAADVLYKMGTKLMHMGRCTEAMRCLETALDLQPGDRATLMAAGNCALELGDTRRAQQCYEELVALDGAMPGAYHNLGVCHFLHKDYEAGIEACRKALALKQDYSLARHKLVLANMHLNRWREARALLDEGLQLAPRDPAMMSLKRRWTYRRMVAWATHLARATQKLVGQT